jgi:hypothetical protein
MNRIVDRTSLRQATCWLTRERAGDPSGGGLILFTLFVFVCANRCELRPQEIAKLAGPENPEVLKLRTVPICRRSTPVTATPPP